MNLKKLTLVIGLVFALSSTSFTGCGATLGTIIAVVLSVVNDAILIVDQISGYVDEYFAENENVELQKKVNDAVFRCREALILINHAAQGGKALGSEDVQLALAEFNKAFYALMNLVRPLGVRLSSDLDSYGVGARLIVRPPRTLTEVNRHISLNDFVRLSNGRL